MRISFLSAFGICIALCVACSPTASGIDRCVLESLGPDFLSSLVSAEAALVNQGVLSASTREGYLDLNRRVYAGEVADGAGCDGVLERSGKTCTDFGYPSRIATFAVCVPEVGEQISNGSDVPFVEAILRGLTDEQLQDIRYRGAVIAQTLGDLENIE